VTEDFFDEEDFQGKIDRNIIKRIFQFAMPYRNWFFAFICFTLLTTLMDSIQVILNKYLIDQAILTGSKSEAVRIVRYYGLTILVQAVSVFGFVYIAGMIGERIWYDLRQKMFTHLQKLSLSYFSVTPVGWIMSRVNSDSYRISDLVTWGLVDSSFAIVNILVSLGFMLAINWQMALIVLAITPIMIVTAWQFRLRILKEYRNVRRLNSKVTGSYNENISGIRVIKGLLREQENLREFNELTSPMFQSAYRAARLNALFLPCIQILSAVALASIILLSQKKIDSGMITIGGIQAFINYVTSMLWPVQDLARVYGEMQQSIASGERIFTLLDTEPVIRDSADAYEPESIAGDIEFDHVSFYYDDGDGTPVLEDFSLKVRQGEVIALVGSTGGGKSTIVNLLCRFYEPKKGVIRINGNDYKTYKMESIQSRIGMVLQVPHLFSGTIRENLQYGNLNASDDQLHEAAKAAGADEFIQSLPNGYDEQVGENGNLLSVGQKQLISLARAILANPELFIMDEATSSVDTITENLIQKGMEQLMKGRTSFIIAHRLSTIKRADRIIVIEDGRIIEEGTHNGLLKQKGKYYHLYTQQFRQEKEKDYALQL
jgi:ATP-binding cassette subfamily B protein